MSYSMMDILAKFIKETKLEDIPPETLTFTKELSLKTLAGMVAGSATGAAKLVQEFTHYYSNDYAPKWEKIELR